ncbi:formate dehydrogenase subunit gamma [Cobetia sp. L2A1]|uniref:formate dehydrogenase subunit gamma n=1 Tax=Cobetia sp. L2A1 TaxID=2686360 RepID=UPI0018EF1D1C|nr:formate dehydrogenase subunit gamma [Cobetia sp. L2A1]
MRAHFTTLFTMSRLLVVITFLSLVMASLWLAPLAVAADPSAEIGQAVGTVDADTWRQVKDGDNSIDSRHDSNYSLINQSGETWRQIRNRWISPGGLIALGGMLAVLAIFYLLVGRNDLDHPRSGKLMLRWTALERAMHWTLATLFLILAITGINLLWGKFVFRNIFGDVFWANMIMATKLAHNYLGPLFSIMLILVLAKWLSLNLPKKHDFEWFRQGGGMIKGKHPDAGFANGGEKAWYWILASVGLVVVVSGLIMDFPIFGQTRDVMQWTNAFHGIASLILIAVSFGHIYIGTAGTEGALEGMKTGYVDETWAKQHHNLWYDEVKQAEAADPQSDPSTASDDALARHQRPN